MSRDHRTAHAMFAEDMNECFRLPGGIAFDGRNVVGFQCTSRVWSVAQHDTWVAMGQYSVSHGN